MGGRPHAARLLSPRARGTAARAHLPQISRTERGSLALHPSENRLRRCAGPVYFPPMSRPSRLVLLPLLATLLPAPFPALAQHEHGGGFLGGNAPIQAGPSSGNVIDVPTPDVGAN